MESNRHDEFISITNKITKYLIETYGLHEKTTFGASLYEAKNRKNNIIIRFWKELGVYRELRNVLVHEQVDSYKLAEPHANINERLAYIYQALTGPTRIYEVIDNKVVTFNSNDSLSTVLEVVKKMGYTQFPVFSDVFEGLLTDNGITRWLANQMDNDIIQFSDTRIGNLISIDEHSQSYKFKLPNDSLFDVLDIFENGFLANSRSITVLVVNKTKDIKPQDIVGIITYWDLENIKIKLNMEG